MCVCVCVSVRSFLPPRASRPRNIRNIGTYVRVHCDTGKTFIIVIFSKNGYQRNQLKVVKPLIVAILTENASFTSFVRISQYKMRRYILVHLDMNQVGVFAPTHTIVVPELNARGLLLITTTLGRQ